MTEPVQAQKQDKPSFFLVHMSDWPPATQALIVVIGILAVMSLALALIAGFGPDKAGESAKPIIDGVMNLLKVLAGAFAGSLTTRTKT